MNVGQQITLAPLTPISLFLGLGADIPGHNVPIVSVSLEDRFQAVVQPISYSFPPALPLPSSQEGTGAPGQWTRSPDTALVAFSLPLSIWRPSGAGPFPDLGHLRLTRQGSRHRFLGEGEAPNEKNGFNAGALQP